METAQHCDLQDDETVLNQPYSHILNTIKYKRLVGSGGLIGTVLVYRDLQVTSFISHEQCEQESCSEWISLLNRARLMCGAWMVGYHSFIAYS